MPYFDNPALIGNMFLVFSLAALLELWRRHLKWYNKWETFQYVLMIITGILLILSIYVSIVMGIFIYFYYSDLKAEQNKEEIKRSNERYESYHKIIVEPLEQKCKSLEEQLEDTYFKQFEEGHRSGYSSGYHSGYIDATKDRFEYPYLTEGTKWEQLRAASKEAKRHLQEWEQTLIELDIE